MKREPSLYIASIGTLMALAAGFGIPGLNDNQAGLITAALTALLGVWTALKVRPVAPAAFTYATGTIATLLATYGLDLSQRQVGLVDAAVLAVLALLLRGNVSPAVTTPESAKLLGAR